VKKNNNIIIINGRHYDSKTGESLSRPEQSAAVRHEAARRKPAGHVPAHPPKPSQTLMRQVVKKPSDSLKRRIKVQGHLDSSAERASSKIIARPSARQPGTQRLQHPATKRNKGRLISHFSPDLFVVESHTPSVTYGSVAVKRTAAKPAPTRKPRTTAELLDYAVQHADAPRQPLAPERKHRRKLFKRSTHQAAAR
jgi:hypothetical protein